MVNISIEYQASYAEILETKSHAARHAWRTIAFCFIRSRVPGSRWSNECRGLCRSRNNFSLKVGKKKSAAVISCQEPSAIHGIPRSGLVGGAKASAIVVLV